MLMQKSPYPADSAAQKGKCTAPAKVPSGKGESEGTGRWKGGGMARSSTSGHYLCLPPLLEVHGARIFAIGYYQFAKFHFPKWFRNW